MPPPVLAAAPGEAQPEECFGSSVGSCLLYIAGLTLVSVVLYLPFLFLPLISDDYTQILLSRVYGSVSGWSKLADDVLYRSRATSLLLTHWVDLLFGASALAHNVLNLAVHIANVLLVFSLGSVHFIGWKTSRLAAFFFAVSSVYQEAVVWNAALPELLVFTFVLLASLSWYRSLARDSRLWLALVTAGYILALCSKESGIVALPVFALLWYLRPRRSALVVLILLAGLTGVYAWGIFASSRTHLHLNDGTFSLHAPFALTLLRSAGRMLWPWGYLGLALIITLRPALGGRKVAAALGWIVVALLPYSFLLYMPRVPSRHLYLASLSLGFLIAWGVECVLATTHRRRVAAAMALASIIAVQNAGHLWGRKLRQFEIRAAVTERFLRMARQGDTPIVIQCAPYGPEVFRNAAIVQLGKPATFVLFPAEQKPGVPVRTFCETEHP